jgi:hypothetical protein
MNIHIAHGIAHISVARGRVRGGAVGLVDDASGAESLADAFYYASYATTIAYFAAAEWAVRGEDGSGSGSRGGET